MFKAWGVVVNPKACLAIARVSNKGALHLRYLCVGQLCYKKGILQCQPWNLSGTRRRPIIGFNWEFVLVHVMVAILSLNLSEKSGNGSSEKGLFTGFTGFNRFVGNYRFLGFLGI